MTEIIHLLIAATKFSLRLLTLSFVHLLGFIIAAQLTGVADRTETRVAEAAADQDPQVAVVADAEDQSSPTQAQVKMLGIVAGVCVLNSAVLMLWIQRVRSTDWR